MRRLALIGLTVIVALALAAVLDVGQGSAHRDPCHSAHTCPSDHHTYAWGPHALVCTSYSDERRPQDTQIVVDQGRTYYCSRGSTAASGDTNAGTSGGTCGVERWAVKTMTDPAAAQVRLTPQATTIAKLRALRPPTALGPTRRPPIETRTWKVSAHLVGFKREADSDIHLVIADPNTGGTMIVEFPASTCVGTKAHARARTLIQAARRAFTQACGPATDSYRHISGTATVTGVGFFDFKHGQTGVAPNAIELHPVLRFAATSCRPA
jgi:hypothetical protein